MAARDWTIRTRASPSQAMTIRGGSVDDAMNCVWLNGTLSRYSTAFIRRGIGQLGWSWDHLQENGRNAQSPSIGKVKKSHSVTTSLIDWALSRGTDAGNSINFRNFALPVLHLILNGSTFFYRVRSFIFFLACSPEFSQLWRHGA